MSNKSSGTTGHLYAKIRGLMRIRHYVRAASSATVLHLRRSVATSTWLNCEPSRTVLHAFHPGLLRLKRPIPLDPEGHQLRIHRMPSHPTSTPGLRADCVTAPLPSPPPAQSSSSRPAPS